MQILWLAALVVLGIWAVAGAREAKWKLINLGIILGMMAEPHSTRLWQVEANGRVNQVFKRVRYA